jgi:hypothetical protein
VEAIMLNSKSNLVDLDGTGQNQGVNFNNQPPNDDVTESDTVLSGAEVQGEILSPEEQARQDLNTATDSTSPPDATT